MSEAGRRAPDDTRAPVRLDKWLWAARFFKTRALAAQAVSGGHVHVNALRVKPARAVRVGDEVAITKGPYAFRVTVTALSGRRGSAEQARGLYEEHADSIAARAALAEQRRAAAAMPAPNHRPDKRARRRIVRFTRKEH